MPDRRTWRIRFGKRHKKKTPIRDGTSLNDTALSSQADTPSLSMVPALALGIGDIQKRVEAQAKTSEAHKAKLEVLLRSCHLLSFLSNTPFYIGNSQPPNCPFPTPCPLHLAPHTETDPCTRSSGTTRYRSIAASPFAHPDCTLNRDPTGGRSPTDAARRDRGRADTRWCRTGENERTMGCRWSARGLTTGWAGAWNEWGTWAGSRVEGC